MFYLHKNSTQRKANITEIFAQSETKNLTGGKYVCMAQVER